MQDESKMSERVTELESLMQEQINMINSQKKAIKEQENTISTQKTLIGKLSRDRQVDSDYDTYATSPYSDTDDNQSPDRKSGHYSRNNKPRIERMNSCSTITNYSMADSFIGKMEEISTNA